MSKPHHGRTIFLLDAMGKGLLKTNLGFVIIGKNILMSRKLKESELNTQRMKPGQLLRRHAMVIPHNFPSSRKVSTV